MTATTDAEKRTGFLARLRADQSGNVVAIVAAALLPLTVMIGGGIDMSRVYMVKTRLQQACDAGVLAGRKAVGEGTFDADAQARAENFFQSNFPDGYQSTANTDFDTSSTNGGTTVTGVATTEVPTLIMDAFGKDKFDLQVTCDAKLEVSNSDIMMVLDTTGSMVCPEDSDTEECEDYIDDYGIVEGENGTTSRMVALKAAMIDFNEILADAASGTTARIRYGFVPFSSSVNVGKLVYDLDPSYLVGGSSGDTVTYQSRVPVYKKVASTTDETLKFRTGSTTYSAWTTSSACDSDSDRYASNSSSGLSIRYGTTSSSTSSSTWYASNGANSGYTNGEPATTSSEPGYYFEFSHGSWTYVFTRSGTNYGTCVRKAKKFTYTYDGTETGAEFSHYEYKAVNRDVYDYVQTGVSLISSSITDPSDNILDDPDDVTWAGCIQERETVSDASFSYNSLTESISPSGATDLDIDTAPNSAGTKWSPLWPEIAYYRLTSGGYLEDDATSNYGGKASGPCPTEARLLSEMDATSFAAYANSLNPVGGTYHDVGAIWGARLASPDGIFSDNVLEEPDNQSAVSRHMIFLTDGQLSTGYASATAYGVEWHDRKVTDDGYTDQNARHLSRFAALCDAIKAKGIRIWVISFGTDLSTSLSDCASANSTKPATDQEELINAFVSIAQSIADLRLSK